MISDTDAGEGIKRRIEDLNALLDAYRSGAMITKTLETPEWWSSLPWVLCFMLMSIEFIFRMDRLRAAGWTRPFTSLEDGVARYVPWLHDHV